MGSERKWAYVWLTFLFLSGPLQAGAINAEPIRLSPDAAPFVVADHAEYLVEDFPPFEEGLTPQMFYPDIEHLLRQAEEGEFQPVTTRHIGIGLRPAVVSVRVPVQSTSDQPETWILAFNRAAQYYFSVYFVEDGKPPPAAPLFKFDVDFDSWTDSDVLIHTPFTMPANGSGTLYISYQSLNGAAPMTLETPAGYDAKRQAQDLHFVSVVGLTLGLMIITASLMLTLRRFVALYYAAAVFSGLLLVLVSEQYVGVLAPRLTEVTLSDTFLTYAALSGPVFALLFQRQFFADVGGTGKTFGRVLLFAAVFAIVSMVGVVDYQIFPLVLPIIALSTCIILIIVNGFIAVLRGFVGRWPFFVGSFVFAAGSIIKVASYEFSWLISAREASLVLLYSIAIEATALASTMFMQVRSLRQDREIALQEKTMAAKENLAMAKAMSHAAHDIRQPLASMRLVMAGAPEAERHADFGKAIAYLEDIVQRQLLGTSADAEQVSQPSSPSASFDMGQLFGNIETMFGTAARAKGISLRIVQSSARADADIFAVMRIVSNLVSNAVQNTQTGGVLIGCRHDGPFLWIEVIDTGSGLDLAQLNALQQPYVRQGAYIGNGLGLSIVRDLCNEHGLTLDVQSTPAKGSRFRLRVSKHLSQP